MNRALPEGFTRLAIDARRPLPLSVTVRVGAGSFRLILVATPADIAGVVARPLDSPWFEGSARRTPTAARGSTMASVLGDAASPVPEGLRPTIVIASTAGVHWARPVVMGRVQRVVDSSGPGHLFDLVITACELRSASLVAPADVGAEIVIGVRDSLAAIVPPVAAGTQEDPHDNLR